MGKGPVDLDLSILRTMAIKTMTRVSTIKYQHSLFSFTNESNIKISIKKEGLFEIRLGDNVASMQILAQ